MSTPDFDSSAYYADRLRKKVESFKKKEEEKNQHRLQIQSAFQHLSSTVMDFYNEAELNLLIECEDKVLEYELEKINQFDNEQPSKCQVRTLRFHRDYVSVLFAPYKNITSGFGMSKTVMIGFVLKAEIAPHVEQDATGTLKYKPSPDEQYTLQYIKDEGWSVNILPRSGLNNRTQQVKFFDEQLTLESFLRILNSFFSPVIK
ncbi:hypothetical protein CWS43_26745 [Rahnella sp. AA]|uniref:hypothetical protein n=1 Tax=Rahnella sp. AA TaxID=2057180 RepID=UPI000C3323FE|nr:hypothetical protein [Rahnella sp. AA]PKE27448.1 hypothetical protein CWS43_26745 [Rahnella sp. AA]